MYKECDSANGGLLKFNLNTERLALIDQANRRIVFL